MNESKEEMQQFLEEELEKFKALLKYVGPNHDQERILGIENRIKQLETALKACKLGTL